MKDFSVSLRSISFSEARRLINDGNNKNVTKNETINPKVIIQPKSIIGLMPLNTKDRKAHIVVKRSIKYWQHHFFTSFKHSFIFI